MNRRAHLTALDLSEAPWVKSSHSAGEGNCVEVADLRRTRAVIAVRDSKDPDGSALVFTPTAFAAFMDDACGSRDGT